MLGHRSHKDRATRSSISVTDRRRGLVSMGGVGAGPGQAGGKRDVHHPRGDAGIIQGSMPGAIPQVQGPVW